MSLTPIFDATLADAPVNIWQASSVFPQPSVNWVSASPWTLKTIPEYTEPLTSPAHTSVIARIGKLFTP